MELNELTENIIGCAIRAHRILGPGLLEAVYEEALCIELNIVGHRYVRQLSLPATYKGYTIGQYRIDVVVEDLVVVEIKSVERHDPVFEAQLLTYLRIASKPLGLLINFNRRLLKDGLKRFILESAL